MTAWGLVNAHLEPWEFGHPGWANERLSTHVVAPVKDALTAEVIAWTPGTDGPVRSEVVQVDVPPTTPTEEELAAYFDGIAGKVRGKIVLVGKHETPSVAFNPPTKRRDDTEVEAAYDPEDLGVLGATTTKSRRHGGSDHTFSTPPDCPASEWDRIRSSTAAIPGTPTSTPMSGSFLEMR